MLRVFGTVCKVGCLGGALLGLTFGGVSVAEAGSVFVGSSANPVLENSPSGNWDSGFVDPGSVILHDGQFHMFYAGIPSWPSALQIGYATSNDGENWQRASEQPVLKIEETGLEGQSIAPNSALVTKEGLWVLYFTIMPSVSTSRFTGYVGRATASSPLGPWTAHPGPVLLPGSKGTWDGRSVGHASVVEMDNGYRLYYAGYGVQKVDGYNQTVGNIGMASSEDGLNWVKHNNPETNETGFIESDPVFVSNDQKYTWDRYNVIDPNVQKTPEGWKMVYRGTEGSRAEGPMGLALSQDGIKWERASKKPAVKASSVGKSSSYFATYLYNDGQEFIFFEGGSAGGTSVYLVRR